MNHQYWVRFPNRIHDADGDNWHDSRCILVTNSQDEAFRLMLKYDAPYFEKLQWRKVDGKYGRYASKFWTNPNYPELDNLSLDEIYNLWSKKPPVIIPSERIEHFR